MYVSVLDSCAISFRRLNQLLSLLLAIASISTYNVPGILSINSKHCLIIYRAIQVGTMLYLIYSQDIPIQLNE